jgi:hypothetical protein
VRDTFERTDPLGEFFEVVSVFFALEVEARVALGPVGASGVVQQVGLVGLRGIDEPKEFLEVSFVDRSGLFADGLENLEVVF